MKHSDLLFSLIISAVLSCVLTAETSALQTVGSVIMIWLLCFGAVTFCFWLVSLIISAVVFLIDLFQFIGAANAEADDAASEFDEIERAMKTSNQEPGTRN